MRVAGRSPRTLETYAEATSQLRGFLEKAGHSLVVADIKRSDLEDFLLSLGERWSPATVSNRFRALQSLFGFVVAVGELDRSPLGGLTPPRVPEKAIPVLTFEDVCSLLATASGTGFDPRRDSAIVRMLFDTGMRRAELCGLTCHDIDMELAVASVMGKGRRPRSCPFGDQTATAPARYLRVRAKHAHAGVDALWLGRNGSLSTSGVAQMLRRRGRQAGVEVHPHMFRHAFASAYLSDGGQESDLMRLAGWRSSTMAARS